MTVRVSAWVVLLFIGSAACNVTYTSKSSVEVHSDGSIEEKIELTQRVAAALESAQFRDTVGKAVPSATSEQLEALHIKWVQVAGVTLRSDGTEATSAFYIQCVITTPEKLSDNTPVLESCKQLIQEELSRQLAGERAA